MMWRGKNVKSSVGEKAQNEVAKWEYINFCDPNIAAAQLSEFFTFSQMFGNVFLLQISIFYNFSKVGKCFPPSYFYFFLHFLKCLDMFFSFFLYFLHFLKCLEMFFSSTLSNLSWKSMTWKDSFVNFRSFNKVGVMLKGPFIILLKGSIIIIIMAKL